MASWVDGTATGFKTEVLDGFGDFSVMGISYIVKNTTNLNFGQKIERDYRRKNVLPIFFMNPTRFDYRKTWQPADVRELRKTMKSEVHFEHRSEPYWGTVNEERRNVYPIGIGFPVFPVTYSDIFYFFLRSLIPDKLPKEEK
jgi:hypothetical protein